MVYFANSQGSFQVSTRFVQTSVCSLWCTHHQMSPSTKHCIQKNVQQILQFFQPWISGFYSYELAYTYRRQEFQNILQRKLCSCMRQLLLNYIIIRNVEHGIEHDIDSAINLVCIHQTFMKITADLMNTLQFKQMMNVTVFSL